MTPKHRNSEIRMIPVDRIDILNPRDRNKRVFDEIVGNIKAIGLKKPITVTPRMGDDDQERYQGNRMNIKPARGDARDRHRKWRR